MDPNCFANILSNGISVGKVAQLNCLPSTILTAADTFIMFSGVTALFLIAWAGIRMITSGGDAKQIEAFKKIITYAIIGLIVVLSAFAIINLIGYATKTSQCLTNIDSINTGCI